MEDTQLDDTAKALGAHTTWEVDAMDTGQFDELVRTLAATGSRRWILAALAGGLFSTLSGRGAGDAGDKVRICHATTSDTNSFVEIEVSVTAAPDHLAHGDFYRNGCCVDDDCANGQRCVEGSCRERALEERRSARPTTIAVHLSVATSIRSATTTAASTESRSWAMTLLVWERRQRATAEWK